MLEVRTAGSDGSAASLIRYIYSNHLSTSSLELDEKAQIVSYEEYHPYGTTSYQSMDAGIKAVAKRYRYTGKERDEESGLYYMSARYYIPWLALWGACDPLERKFSPASSYCYSHNDPIELNDKNGMAPPPGCKPDPDGGDGGGNSGGDGGSNKKPDKKPSSFSGSDGAPNPNKGSFNVRLQSADFVWGVLIVTDILGREIRKQRVWVLAGRNAYFYEDFAPGVYLLKYESSIRNEVIKVVVN